MQLSLESLKQRYDFWKEEIGNAGIWDANLFQNVEIVVRPKSKRYNGLFSRKWLLRGGKRVRTDRIFIYRNSEDFDPVFLDSILVHEMIHQYILQNKLRDTSTHGRLFRTFMNRINTRYPNELNIHISALNPSVALKGPGSNLHYLALLYTDKHFYCCVINPKKVANFDPIIKKYLKNGVLKGYDRAVSNDVMFDRFVKCTKTLHGLKKKLDNLNTFLETHQITII